MKILVFWDIYGRVGRKAFEKEFQNIKNTHAPDICIANIENITSGRGPAAAHAEFIDSLGVDLMTLWDHSYDNMPNINEYFSKNTGKIIRPANFYESKKYPLPGKWYQIIEKNGVKLLVVQLLWEVFMSHKVYNPFQRLDEIYDEVSRNEYDISIVEFHRETTAEFYGMAHYVWKRAQLIYGTHTHVQTNDAHIMESWLAVLTDVGMNGPFGGVIGAEFSSVEKRFLSWIGRWKIEQKLGKNYIINALICEIDTVNKKATSIENISFTGTL